MKNLGKKQYTLSLTPLTALHIGTGEEVSPFEYGIINYQNHKIYVRYNLDKILERLNEEEMKTFENISDKNDIRELRSFFRKYIQGNLTGNILYHCYPSEDFIRDYENNLNNLNTQLIVNAAYRPIGSRTPYIPGSSIKGAIRTALLDRETELKTSYSNKIVKEKVEASKGKLDRTFQQFIFNYQDPKNDPFRALSIADCQIEGKTIQIVAKAVIKKKGEEKAGTEKIKLYYEMIRGSFLKLGNKQDNSYGETSLSIDFDLEQSPFITASNNKLKLSNITYKITREKIIEDCNSFYRGALQDEFDKHYLGCDDENLRDNILKLQEEVEGFNTSKGEFLLRIGRFSQAECVTVNNYRAPKSKKGYYGKTRTLATYNDIFLPLGWVKACLKDD